MAEAGDVDAFFRGLDRRVLGEISKFAANTLTILGASEAESHVPNGVPPLTTTHRFWSRPGRENCLVHYSLRGQKVPAMKRADSYVYRTVQLYISRLNILIQPREAAIIHFIEDVPGDNITGVT